MVSHVDPSRHRRTLRKELRAARDASGLTQREAAERLSWSPSKLLRVEAGQVGLSLRDVRALADLYGIRDAGRRDLLEKAARGSKGSSWWAKYHDLLSPQFSQYLGLEQASDSVSAFHPIVIPGQLQTRAYAAALLRPRVKDAERRARLAALREERSEWLFDAEGTTSSRFVIAEEALDKNPGDPVVMRDQLAQLQVLAGHPRVEIAILPKTYPFHYSTLASFVLLGYSDDSDLLYLEHATGSMTNGTDLELIADYQSCFESIFSAAWREQDCGERIERAMAEVA